MMIQMAFIISLIILFIHATTWNGQINQWIRKYIQEDMIISKPIYNCPICMTPYWGNVIYLLLWGWGGLRENIGVIGCACGFSVVWVVLIHAKEYFTSRTWSKQEEETNCCK